MGVNRKFRKNVMKHLQGPRQADIYPLIAALTALRPPNKGCLEASSLADGLCVSGVRFPKGADVIVQVGKEERMRGRRSGCLAGRRLVFGLVLVVRAICASGVLVATLGPWMNALDILAARLGYSAIRLCYGRL